jgi:hypothetical protein
MNATQWLGLTVLIFIMGFVVFVFFTGARIRRSDNDPHRSSIIGEGSSSEGSSGDG